MKHQKLNVHEKTTFLPMLCSKPSIKDVLTHTHPKSEDHSVSISSEDPLSPKIGCMGQVKRNNKIIGFPSSSNHCKLALTAKSSTNVKYLKLRRLFSAKNLTTTASCTRKEVNRNSKVVCEGKQSRSVNIYEMDPPLPVVKKVVKTEDNGEETSLWKRRSGGSSGLKSLELQQIQVPRHRLEINTV